MWKVWNARTDSDPRELLRTIATILTGLVLIAVLDLFGAVAAIDEGLRDRYVQLEDSLDTAPVIAAVVARIGAGRETLDHVVVIAGDRETVAAWGPPPWSAARLDTLLTPIRAGRPAAIVELGHPRMFEPDAYAGLDPPDPEDSPLLVDESNLGWAEGGLDRGLGHGFSRGELIIDPEGPLAELIVTSGWRAHPPARLPIRWLTPRGRLPVIPAHHVAGGQVPARSFAGRVVVLGVTDPRYSRPVATPIGPLSPVEVESHAICALADAELWADLPRTWAYGIAALFGLLVSVALDRSGRQADLGARALSARAALLLALVTGLVLMVDLLTYERGLVRLGSARPLIEIAVVGFARLVRRNHTAIDGSSSILARVLEGDAAAATVATDPRADDREFWRRLAELGAGYAGAVLGVSSSCVVLERRASHSLLEPRAEGGTPSAGRPSPFAERLDVRRAPVRGVWLTLRGAVERLPTSGSDPGDPLRPQQREAVLIPITDRRELYGVWVIEVPEPSEDLSEDLEARISRSQIEALERLGRGMADALIRRRRQRVLAELSDTGALADQLTAIGVGLELARDDARWGLELLEQLPTPAVIATIWGELEWIDPRLLAGAPELERLGLAEVIRRLTGVALERAESSMAAAVQGRVPVEIASELRALATTPTVTPAAGWTIEAIAARRGVALPGFEPSVQDHLLLVGPQQRSTASS